MIPVVITVYEDRSFTFITKSPPGGGADQAGDLAREGLGRAAPRQGRQITQDQLRQIAEKKMKDLNANDVDAAAKIIAGTARSMGVEVV